MSKESKIITEIKNNEKIKRYLELESYINNNNVIKEILTNIKEIQKELVHARALNKKESEKSIQKKYDILLNKLEEQPLLMEYLDLQNEINEFLQDASLIINNSLMVKSSDF